MWVIDSWGKRCGCAALKSYGWFRREKTEKRSTRGFDPRWHHSVRWEWTKAILYFPRIISRNSLLALYGATRDSFTSGGLCVDFSITLLTPCISCVSFFRFRLQKYANAREAVHAISSEASWYYELPCFCSCIKNYLSERYHIYSTIHM